MNHKTTLHPTHNLNTNIPQGRGMIKWQPFASIPEQFEAIQGYIAKQTYVAPPLISDAQQQDIEITIQEKIHALSSCHIIYWCDGQKQHTEGYISQINYANKTIDIETQDNISTYIKWQHIYDIR